MKQIGIVGGAGYTAGELIRILLHHPKVKIKSIQSQSNAGKPISSVHADLVGESELVFSADLDPEIDVLFLCSGHGKSRTFLNENKISASTKVIDLSNDFRLKKDANDFIYGLPEVNKQHIVSSSRIANPGCFATAIQLAIIPLAKNNLLDDEIHVNAITGSTGAGQSPTPTSHFSWRNNNISVYKAFSHQHLDEISETVNSLQPNYKQQINFIPLRGDFSRGIHASVYTTTSLREDQLIELYKKHYQDDPFTIVSDSGIHLKQVINTNKCLVHVEKHNGKVFITSVIDNLLKGASGQAVQNMNLMLEYPQETGLKLKSSYF